ncbi:hypothetical protein Taro_028308 [Colocasia esculenta]|uniref:RNase H type-1 domain-containing protein n=1 Tax=Colocasia esculenta TaxID=4460 RepID=A0A843VTV5_COLES|nr:hypothetical protein [Colocasia esculenta]
MAQYSPTRHSSPGATRPQTRPADSEQEPRAGHLQAPRVISGHPVTCVAQASPAEQHWLEACLNFVNSKHRASGLATEQSPCSVPPKHEEQQSLSPISDGYAHDAARAPRSSGALTTGNRARFQEQIMSAKHIVNRCMLSIRAVGTSFRAVGTSFKLQKLSQLWLTALRQIGGGHEYIKVNIPTVVKWLHPSPGRLKLNVDGAFKLAAGGAGGGGILRDHKGICVFAFAKNYQGIISILAAEALALCDGLTICCSKGFMDIVVETDSLNLVQIVTGQIPHPWELSCILQDVDVITQKIKAQIKHVPREANQVAHSLASYGCFAEHVIIWDSGAVLPHVVKGPYCLDKVGCHTFRP